MGSDKKETIRDPTGWLKSAAMRKVGGGRMMMSSKGYGKGRRGGGGAGSRGNKISKSIGWCNKNLNLENPIAYDEVIGHLKAMGEGAACKLLDEFETKCDGITDPTNW